MSIYSSNPVLFQNLPFTQMHYFFKGILVIQVFSLPKLCYKEPNDAPFHKDKAQIIEVCKTTTLKGKGNSAKLDV